jgi:hypothetical protein
MRQIALDAQQKLLPLFTPRAALDAKRCRYNRAGASPRLFRETFVASLYGLWTVGL